MNFDYRPSENDTSAPDVVSSDNPGMSQSLETSHGKLIDIYPLRHKWPSWLREAVKELDDAVSIPGWSELLDLWLKLEHVLNYLGNRVSCGCDHC